MWAHASLDPLPRRRVRRLGDAESDFNGSGDPFTPTPNGPPTPWVLAIRALHSVSVPMGYLRQTVDAEMAQLLDNSQDTTDAQLAQYEQDAAQLASYAAQLPALIAAAKSLPEYTTDAATAAELNNWLAFLVDWANSTGAVIAQLPTTVAQYLATQIAQVGRAASGAATALAWDVLIPVGILGVAVLAFVRQAEKTRTYRKVVA